MNTITREVLRSLSITGNYRGHLYTIIACELIFGDETKLYNVTQDIYCEIAGFTLSAPPTVSEFLAIITGYVRLKAKHTAVRIQRDSDYPTVILKK